ncbi:MAG: DUF3885 domain-containing protein [Tumebacillaceae bacterium]
MQQDETLQDYLDQHFPTLKLDVPLFYLADVGLRFEIATDECMTSKAFELQTIHRALTLFRAVHAPDDEIFLVVNADREMDDFRFNRDRLHVFRRIVRDARVLKKLTCTAFPFFGAENEAEALENQHVKTYRYSLACRVSDVNVYHLIRCIALQFTDPKYRPQLDAFVMVINKSKHTVFNFYDYRGLDIVAERKETLEPIYTTYNDWILDHDREKIDQLFAR